MSGFFKRRGIKCLLTVVALVLVISIVSGIVGVWMQPQSTVIGAVVTPIQTFVSKIGSGVSKFLGTYEYNKELEEENNELRMKLNEATENLVDFDKYRNENEFLRSFLEIKEQHEDYEMSDAVVIATDSVDGNFSFTINRGTLDGISLHDPVITADGVVGYVSSAGANYSTVATLLNSSVNVGAYATRTGEYGVITCTAGLSNNGRCRLSYLSSKTAVTSGDYITTSGLGGIFPGGIVVGTVEEIKNDEMSVSSYATVIPAVDFSTLRRVMVITSFSGQTAADQ